MKIKALLTLSIASILAATSMARANSIEITGFSVTNTAGVFDYSYTMSLTAGNAISATNPNGNSMFVFYDLNGLTGAQATFTGGTTPSSAWSVNIENTSGVWSGGLSTIVSQAGNVQVTDSASLPNIRFQYTGPDFPAVGLVSILGTAHIISTQAPAGFAKYAARWIDTNSGLTQINTDTPQAPGASGAGPSTPLPSSAAMSSLALGGLAMFAFNRRRRLANVV